MKIFKNLINLRKKLNFLTFILILVYPVFSCSYINFFFNKYNKIIKSNFKKK